MTENKNRQTTDYATKEYVAIGGIACASAITLKMKDRLNRNIIIRLLVKHENYQCMEQCRSLNLLNKSQLLRCASPW